MEKMYFIEGKTKNDLIGFNSYRSSLENAIENNAKFIGLISDFGTGKSSLIEMLKDNNEDKYDLVTINLWNCNEKEENETSIDLHRTFLNQLIDKINELNSKIIKNKKYLKAEINENYFKFDAISSKIIYFFILVTFYIIWLFEKVELTHLLINDIQKIMYILLVCFLSVLVLSITKPILSFKKDNTLRNISEFDTIHLYDRIINDYFEKENDKKLIICIEELDRYNDYESVIKYLKEFYKFYKRDNNVVFIIALKSANKLKVRSSIKVEKNDIVKSKDIYEKIFDYIINLDRVNIHNYDSIVIGLLDENNIKLPDGVKRPTMFNMGNWRYLYKGKNITIRDIKHRFNFAMSLYLSIKESEYEGLSFNKCLYISYLEDEYNNLYTKLIDDYDLLNRIFLEYRNNKNIDAIIELDEDEKDIIIDSIEKKLIGLDYMYYFFKFPKGKKPFSINELNLYNSIFYDSDNENLDYSLKELNGDKIKELLELRPDKDLYPRIIFSYPKLLRLCLNNDKSLVLKTIESFYNVKDVTQLKECFESVNDVGKNHLIDLLKEFINHKADEIDKLTIEERFELRSNIVELLKKDSYIIEPLFKDNNVIISSKEMRSIGNIKNIYKLTNIDKIDNNYIKNIESYLSSIGIDELISIFDIMIKQNIYSNVQFYEIVKKSRLNRYKPVTILKIYNKLKEYLNLDNYNNMFTFIDNIDIYYKELDDILVSLIDSNDCECIKKYINICKKYSFVSLNGIEKINECNKKYALNEEMLDCLYKNNYYDTYVICKKLTDDYFDIEDDKFEVLKDYYLKWFANPNISISNVSNKMLDFLYENSDMINLSEDKLCLFVDKKQDLRIIKAVINTDNKEFINKYLEKINKIKKEDIEKILLYLNDYYINSGFARKTKTNITSISKKYKIKGLFDKRKINNK